MILSELKHQLATLSEDERFEVQAFLLHLGRVNDPEHRRQLTEASRQMDAGDRVSLGGFIRDNLPLDPNAMLK